MANFASNFRNDGDILANVDSITDRIAAYPYNILESQLDFRATIQTLGRVLEMVKVGSKSKEDHQQLEKVMNCINNLVSFNSVF